MIIKGKDYFLLLFMWTINEVNIKEKKQPRSLFIYK
jgi:hypothetical protein